MRPTISFLLGLVAAREEMVVGIPSGRDRGGDCVHLHSDMPVLDLHHAADMVELAEGGGFLLRERRRPRAQERGGGLGLRRGNRKEQRSSVLELEFHGVSSVAVEADFGNDVHFSVQVQQKVRYSLSFFSFLFFFFFCFCFCNYCFRC